MLKSNYLLNFPDLLHNAQEFDVPTVWLPGGKEVDGGEVLGPDDGDDYVGRAENRKGAED